MSTSDPDLRTASDAEQTARQSRRQLVARRAVLRALVGAGAMPRENRTGDDWDVEGLPLGGRIRVSASMNRERRQRVVQWMLAHAERRHWGAVAFLNHGGTWGTRSDITVQLPLPDFAMLVGRLAIYERERRRWLDAPDHHDGGPSGG